MTINFYNQSSPTNKINKTLGSSLGTCVIDNIHDINVVDPVFIIKTDALSGSLENLAKANYVVAGSPFNRKYFITGVDFSTAKTATVYCHCDVLSTYASSLGTLNFTRGAGDINEMEDVSYPISDYLVEQYFPMNSWTDIFSNGNDGRRFLLRTICGDARVRIPVALEEGNVFCDNGQWYEDNNNNIQYVCYQFKDTGSNYVPTFVPRADITGIPVLTDGSIVSCGSNRYRWNSYPRTSEQYSNFTYLGTTN